MTKKSRVDDGNAKLSSTKEAALDDMVITIGQNENEAPHSQPEGIPKGISPSKKVDSSTLASKSSSKKMMKTLSVRRSGRIQNFCRLRNDKIQRVIEEITLSDETDEEDELPTETDTEKFEQKDLAELTVGEKTTLEGKFDYVTQLLEAQNRTLNSFKTEQQVAPDAKYKNMYIASQKKIEELAEENQVLTDKLANVLDQFESYKNGRSDVIEVLEKWKDVILISNVSEVSEAAQATTTTEAVVHDDKVISQDAGEIPSV